MTINFGVCNSDKRALTKSIGGGPSMSGTLRNETSVVNPTILVQGSVETLSGCNYMEIPAFHRKYFITDVTSVSDDLCMVSGHCDVLATYASGIRSNQAILGRSASNWNLYINDGSFKVTNKTKIVTKVGGLKPFPNRSSILMVAVCQSGPEPEPQPGT